MRAAKVQASLRIRAVSPEPSLLAHTNSESRGTFRQKARSLAPLNGWACAGEICHDGMLEDTNSLDGAQVMIMLFYYGKIVKKPLRHILSVEAIKASFEKHNISALEVFKNQLSPAKRICVFEHSVITNFNCACPAIQRAQGSGFLSEGSS